MTGHTPYETVIGTACLFSKTCLSKICLSNDAISLRIKLVEALRNDSWLVSAQAPVLLVQRPVSAYQGLVKQIRQVWGTRNDVALLVVASIGAGM